jgi:hypothetical protein
VGISGESDNFIEPTPSLHEERNTPEKKEIPTNNTGESVSLELDGVDWGAKIARRKSSLMKNGSMPNLIPAVPQGMSSPTANLFDSFRPFGRVASSAEDDTVGALRTRVINASFMRRRSTDDRGKKPTAHKRKFKPSMSMPAAVMKKVIRVHIYVHSLCS